MFQRVLLTTALSCTLLGLIASPLMAVSLTRDNFDYDVGEIGGAGGGTGDWVGNWTNFGHTALSEVVTPATPLTYNTGAATLGGGNALRLSRTPDNSAFTPALRAYANTPGETFYFRYLLRLEADTWDDNDFFVGFVDSENNDGTHSNNLNSGLRGAFSGEADFMARLRSNQPMLNPAADFAYGETYLLVIKAEDLGGGLQYDTLSFWVNPTVGDEASPDAFISDPTGAAASFTGNLPYIGWRFGNNLDTDDVFLVDDVALASSWNDIMGAGAAPIPEPLTVTMLGLGGLALALRRRRSA